MGPEGKVGRLEIRVTPRASSNRIVGVDAWGRLKVRVTAPPVEGAANQAVIKLVAKALGISRGKVMLIRGETSRNKTLDIDGMSEHELQRRLIDTLK